MLSIEALRQRAEEGYLLSDEALDRIAAAAAAEATTEDQARAKDDENTALNVAQAEAHEAAANTLIDAMQALVRAHEEEVAARSALNATARLLDRRGLPARRGYRLSTLQSNRSLQALIQSFHQAAKSAV